MMALKGDKVSPEMQKRLEQLTSSYEKVDGLIKEVNSLKS